MEAMYSVTAATEDEARRRLTEMCRALGLVPKFGGRPIESLGSGRYMCTATPAQDAELDIASPYGRD